MGEFKPATYAYMIPMFEGKVMEGNRLEPTNYTIYKIRPSQEKAFRRQNTTPGYTWAAIYSMLDMTDAISIKDED